jgi:hypothetical protein
MKSMFKGALGALMLVLALSGLTAASALAAGAPIVETKAATGVDGTEATLNGTVNPNGSKGNTYDFEYGTTTSYGSKTSKFLLETGNEAIKVSRVVDELKPGTLYHFRLVATNANGTTDGSDLTFTTLAAKPEFFKEGAPFPWSFELRAGATSWSKGSSTFECGAVSGSGVVSGPVTVSSTTLNFTGCGYQKGESRIFCTSEGAKQGEIRTTEAEGHPVYISKAAKTVGLEFEPTGGFFCQGSGTLRGSIVIPITPVNVFTETFKISSTPGSKEYESEKGEAKIATLETDWPGGVWEHLGWGFTGTLTTSKTIEIAA